MTKPFRSLGLLLAVGLLATAGCCTKKPAPAPAPEVQAAAPTPAPVPVPTEAPIAVPVAEPVAETLPADLAELNRKGYLKDVFFDYDQYDVRADQRDAMAANAEWLKKWPTVKIQIEGHCDERGSNKYNMALGDKRANAAKDYLVSLGIDASRVSTISYGEERPFVEGHDEAAWAQNRRGHFLVTAK
ncbi:MAG: peptidoglycan-associated lipoprotein Pal [Thermoanaerobaculia bacterium]